MGDCYEYTTAIAKDVLNGSPSADMHCSDSPHSFLQSLNLVLIVIKSLSLLLVNSVGNGATVCPDAYGPIRYHTMRFRARGCGVS